MGGQFFAFLPIRHCPHTKMFFFHSTAIYRKLEGGEGLEGGEEEAHPLSKSDHVSLQAYINII